MNKVKQEDFDLEKRKHEMAESLSDVRWFIEPDESKIHIRPNVGFSKEEFKWLLEEKERKKDPSFKPSYHRSGKQRDKDRYDKHRCKKRIKEAVRTLHIAALFDEVFTEEEWKSLIPYRALSNILTIISLRQGYEAVSFMIHGINNGFDNYTQKQSGGLIKAQVSLSLLPQSDMIDKFQIETLELAKEYAMTKLKESIDSPQQNE